MRLFALSQCLNCVCLLVFATACGRVGYEPLSKNGADAGLPAHCANGVQDDDEQDIDCGGSCLSCGGPSVPMVSCAAIRDGYPQAQSGVYMLDIDDSGPTPSFAAYCELQADGGGWTLAAKLDGSQSTFEYDQPIWTNAQRLNETSTNMDPVEAKLMPFTTIPLTQLRVGMTFGGQTNWLVLSASGASLRALFMTDSYVASSLGRVAWLGLLEGSELQGGNCALEGINVHDTGGSMAAVVRVGILGDENNQCDNPDSVVGFGTRAAYGACLATSGTRVYTGNCITQIPSPAWRSAFGYLMIR